MNGSKGGMIFCTGWPLIMDAVKRQTPNGGVRQPILILMMTMMPKCIGSIPSIAARGASIGAEIMMMALLSMNIPAISNVTFTKSNIKYLLDVRASIALKTAPGTCSAATIQPNKDAYAMI